MNIEALELLKSHRGQIDHLIAVLSAELGEPVTLPEAVSAVALAAKQRRPTPTDWPKVGGRDLVLAETDLFQSAAFRERWKPSGERRAIYVGGCDGLRDLSRSLQIPVFKIGITDPDHVSARMKSLRRAAYGAVWFRDGECVEDKTGWTSWFVSNLYGKYRPPSPASPVRVDPCTIYVDLPAGLHWTAFDAAFDAEAAKARLSTWIVSEEGLAHCRLLGVDPARYQRMTLYGGGTDGSLRQATEICCFSLYNGTDRLVEIAERIILRHLKIDNVPAATHSEPVATPIAVS